MEIEPALDNTEPETLLGAARGIRDDVFGLAHRIWLPIAQESSRLISISIGSFGITINRIDDEGATVLASVPAGAEDAALAIHTTLLQTGVPAQETSAVAITLPAGEVLRPRVRLPYVPRRSVRSMLGYELERLSPVPPDELYFDYRIVSRDRKTNKTEIDLRIIKRSVVNQALALAHAARLSVGSILFEGDSEPADRRYFPIDGGGFARLFWRRYSVLLLAGLAVLLAAAVLFAAYARGVEAQQAIDDQIDADRAQAAEVGQIRQEAEDMRAQIEFATAQKKRQPSLLSVLAALTDALPDGTWLSELTVNGRVVHAQGYSQAASDLIGEIGRVRSFANPQFNAPIVQSSNKLDRFDMVFNVKPGAP